MTIALGLKYASRQSATRGATMATRYGKTSNFQALSSVRTHATIPQPDASLDQGEPSFPDLKEVRSFPFVGSIIPALSGIPDKLKDGYAFWPEMREQYGEFYKMGFPPIGNKEANGHPLHIVTDPKQYVQVIRAGGSYPSGGVEPLWVSKAWNNRVGLKSKGLMERGEEWKRVRNFMQTDLLHPQSARGYVPGMISAAELASRGAAASAEELNDYLGRCAFDLFSTIMFGELTQVADPTTPTDPVNLEFVKNASAGLSTSIDMLINPYDGMYHKMGIETKKLQFVFDKFDATWNIAQDKIEKFLERKAKGELTENEKNSYLYRAMDRQSEPGSEVSIEEVKELCFIGLFAAVDTTSAVAGWNLFHIARSPEVQEKLYQELKQAVETVGENGKLTVEALSRENVPYLHAVLRETQRLTPPTPIYVTKQIDVDGVSINGREMKKGDVVSLEGFSTGVNPRFVDEPQEFRPERWSAEAVAARKGTPSEIIDHPFLKEPFSQGARKCPGSRVAINEIQVLMSQLVLDWKISSPVKTMDEIEYQQKTMIEVELPKLQFEARQ